MVKLLLLTDVLLWLLEAGEWNARLSGRQAAPLPGPRHLLKVKRSRLSGWQIETRSC